MEIIRSIFLALLLWCVTILIMYGVYKEQNVNRVKTETINAQVNDNEYQALDVSFNFLTNDSVIISNIHGHIIYNIYSVDAKYAKTFVNDYLSGLFAEVNFKELTVEKYNKTLLSSSVDIYEKTGILFKPCHEEVIFGKKIKK